MQVNCQGLVLKHVKTGGDSLLKIFTKELGKITVAVSLKEVSSTKKAKLPVKPFTVSNYNLYRGRSGYRYNSGDVVRSFFSIGEDFERFAYGSLALELVDAVLEEDQEEGRIYALLVEFLKWMENPKVDGATLVIAFEIKLLKLLGLRPITHVCTHCGKVPESSLFSVDDGGALCKDCYKNAKIKEGQFSSPPLIYSCKFDIMSTIDYFDKRPFKDFEKVKLRPAVSMNMMEIIENYLKIHLQIGELKSNKLLGDI